MDPKTAIITFFSGKKEYRSLSNFWEADIEIYHNYEIRQYESGEHAFHGEKYMRISDYCASESRKAELIKYGQTFMKGSLYKTGAEVKRVGGKRGLRLTENELSVWSTICIQVQKEICIWKFNNYEEVREDLKKSGTKILVHPALRCAEDKIEKTAFWEGKGVVRDGGLVILGKNMLGNIWMSLR